MCINIDRSAWKAIQILKLFLLVFWKLSKIVKIFILVCDERFRRLSTFPRDLSSFEFSFTVVYSEETRTVCKYNQDPFQPNELL